VQPRAALRVTPSPWQTIADAVKGGADAQKALRSFTVDAAREMGLQHEVGVLAAGKSADLVVLDRDPLQESPPRIAGTQVLQTWIGGVRVFARAEPVQP
jgi:imidazolonepropionase-like amidohydrolase